jgi:hypothetical protein
LHLLIINPLLYTSRCLFIYEYGKPSKSNNRLHPRTLIASPPKTPNPRSLLTSQPHNQSFRRVQRSSLTLQKIQLSSYPPQILKSSLKTLALEPPASHEAPVIAIGSPFFAELCIRSSWSDGTNERIQLAAKERELRTTQHSF